MAATTASSTNIAHRRRIDESDPVCTPVDAAGVSLWTTHGSQGSRPSSAGQSVTYFAFRQPKPETPAVLLLTGWNETVLKYEEVVYELFAAGFTVYCYDHFSQGLSSRLLEDEQSTYVPSFEAYVGDFTSFVAFIREEDKHAGPLNVLAHSMGGLISASSLLRNPNLVNSAVFMAPMFRMHCGTPATLWHFPLPFPITHMLTSLSCLLGMEKSHAIGFFNEKPDSKIRWALTTDDKRLERWRQLRIKYPSVISCCVTNRWVMEAIKLQTWFDRHMNGFNVPCMVFQATYDLFVNNNIQRKFQKNAAQCTLKRIPGHCYHEVLMEKDEIRGPVMKDVIEFFNYQSQGSHEGTVEVQQPRESPKGMVTPHRFSFLTWEYLLLVGVCAIGTALILSQEDFPRKWTKQTRR